MSKLQVLVNEGGTLPTKGTPGSAGYDLRSAVDFKIAPGKQLLISTELQMIIPLGYVGFIKSRSGLGLKSSIEAKIGVIDSDYRGEVKVLLYNYGDSTFTGKKGDKIAQLVVLQCMTSQPVSVVSLSSTVRGAGGFGSTGK